jgi:G3E family GTPase
LRNLHDHLVDSDATSSGMTSDGLIQVVVLGGYLGAGKTTVLNSLLRAGLPNGQRMAVLVNDFGAVNIDRSLIESEDEQMLTLQNGCICCSIADGLHTALDAIRSLQPRPAVLVIEASGVSDPVAIGRSIDGRYMRLDALVTVVDAEQGRTKAQDRYVGDVVRRQIAVADLLVLTKTDLVEATLVTATHAWLSSLAPGVAVIESANGVVPLEALLGVDREDRVDRPVQTVVSESESADSIFVSSNWTGEARFDADELVNAVRALPGWVVRVKGVVQSTSGSRLVVHRVGLRVSTENLGSWQGGDSQLVAISLRAEVDDRDPFASVVAHAAR